MMQPSREEKWEWMKTVSKLIKEKYVDLLLYTACELNAFKRLTGCLVSA